MSVTDLPTRSKTPDAPAVDRGRRGGPWLRVALACAILVASGLVRARQAERINLDLKRGRESPAKLDQVPLALGPWEGEPTEIDPRIAEATGADQIVTRRYVNRNTGTSVDLILLFGPARDVYLHSPEKCYPAAGFDLVAGPADKPLGDDPKRAAPFRVLVYSKGEAARAEPVEVYYTWWYNGRWTPNIGKQKEFERISGMYKVHIARRVTPGERRDLSNPNEEFLKVLMPVLERQIDAAQGPTS